MENTDKFDERCLQKHLIVVLIIFLMCILADFGIINIKIPSVCKKNKTDENTNKIEQLNAEMIMDSNNKLVIPLPTGVDEDNISVNSDIMLREIRIMFPKGSSNGLEQTSIVNNSQDVISLDVSSDELMSYITIKLNVSKDQEYCISNGQMYMDFFYPKERYDTVVVIDPGHGGYDVGAIQNGTYEKDIDLEVCKRIKTFTDKERFKVYFTRLDDSYPAVEGRVEFVNEIMPDLFISIHSNWYKNSTISGTSVLYNTNDTSQRGSKWLAGIMQQEVTLAAGTNNKGMMSGNDIYIVRHSNVPVALIEMGFMSNTNDYNLLTTKSGQETIANGVYNGIIRALTEMGKY